MLRSKACRWEFGYVRKPELVHLYVPSDGKSPGRIVKWDELMEDAELCKQLFGEFLEQEFQGNGDAEDLCTMQGTFMQLEKMAKTAEEQEHQAWCELPFRQLAYNFATNTFGEKSKATMWSAYELVCVYLQTGITAKAQQIGEDLLLKKRENHVGKDDLNVAGILTNLGIAHGERGKYTQQKIMFENALMIFEQHCGKNHPYSAAALQNLGKAHGDLGDHSMAKDLLEHALRILEQHYGKEHHELGTTVFLLGVAHYSLGDLCRAKESAERALKIFVQHGNPFPEKVQGFLAQLEVEMAQGFTAATVRPPVVGGFGRPC